MNSLTRRNKSFSPFPTEKNAVKILMEKMGLSRKEIREISGKYGVSALQIIELMQLSKYKFVNNEQQDGQCEPCRTVGLRVTSAGPVHEFTREYTAVSENFPRK